MVCLVLLNLWKVGVLGRRTTMVLWILVAKETTMCQSVKYLFKEHRCQLKFAGVPVIYAWWWKAFWKKFDCQCQNAPLLQFRPVKDRGSEVLITSRKKVPNSFGFRRTWLGAKKCRTLLFPCFYQQILQKRVSFTWDLLFRLILLWLWLWLVRKY